LSLESVLASVAVLVADFVAWLLPVAAPVASLLPAAPAAPVALCLCEAAGAVALPDAVPVVLEDETEALGEA